MEIIAKGKYIRMSPRKIRLVADLIKGLTTEKAKVQLEFSKKDAGKTLLKLLNSAVSNAVNNFGADKGNLKVKEVTVDGGPALKRWMPRAHGRATPIRKMTSHVKLTLEEIVASATLDKKKIKADDSDLIKVGVGEFDELSDTNKEIAKKEVGDKKAKAVVSKKGFANKVLNRKTGSK